MSEDHASDRNLEELNPSEVNGNGGIVWIELEKDRALAAEGRSDREFSSNGEVGADVESSAGGNSQGSLEKREVRTEAESNISVDANSSKIGVREGDVDDHVENGRSEVQVQQITIVEMPASVSQVRSY